MKKIVIILFVATAFNSVYVQAQDINFSQFYEMPLLRNPALTGNFRGDLRVVATFRNQWNSVTVPYQTQALGAELKINPASDTYFSFGVQVTNDVAGDSRLGKTQVLPVLAAHVPVGHNHNAYLSGGFMLGVVQQRFDQSKLKFDDQFVNGAYSATNPTHDMFTNTNLTYLDLAAGLKYSSDFGEDSKYYIGFGAFHLTDPKVAFGNSKDIKLNKKFVFNGGLSIPTSDYDHLIFYLDYFTQGGADQAQGGLLYKHDVVLQDDDFAAGFSVGSFLRWNDAWVPVVKMDYYHLSIGISYDVNISKLKSASHSRGGFEATLSYSDFLNIKSSSLQNSRCPVAVY